MSRPPSPMYLYARSVRRPPYPIYLYARSASRPPYPIYLYAGSAGRRPCLIYLCAGSAGRPPYPIYLCAVRIKTNLSFNKPPRKIRLQTVRRHRRHVRQRREDDSIIVPLLGRGVFTAGFAPPRPSGDLKKKHLQSYNESFKTKQKTPK